jgi:hypothetical protein
MSSLSSSWYQESILAAMRPQQKRRRNVVVRSDVAKNRGRLPPFARDQSHKLSNPSLSDVPFLEIFTDFHPFQPAVMS